MGSSAHDIILMNSIRSSSSCTIGLMGKATVLGVDNMWHNILCKLNDKGQSLRLLSHLNTLGKHSCISDL